MCLVHHPIYRLIRHSWLRTSALHNSLSIEAKFNVNAIVDALLKAGVDLAAASHLAPIIASNGGLLHHLKVPARNCNLVRWLHDQTWFPIEPEGNLTMSKRSSRQGCRYGSMIFSAAYCVVLSEPLENIEDCRAHILCDRGSRAPRWKHKIDSLSTNQLESVSVIDLTYVDDEAIFITGADNDGLASNITRAANLVDKTM